MRSRWIIAVILAIVTSASASAQQSHLDTRRRIEQLAATFSERYNKQDAGAIASMFTKDALQDHIRRQRRRQRRTASDRGVTIETTVQERVFVAGV